MPMASCARSGRAEAALKDKIVQRATAILVGRRRPATNLVEEPRVDQPNRTLRTAKEPRLHRGALPSFRSWVLFRAEQRNATQKGSCRQEELSARPTR